MSTSGQDPFCPVCLRKFWNQKDRDKHVAFIHKKESSDIFTCDVCDKKYMSKVGVDYHKRVKHGGALFKCTVCDISFGHKSALTRHNKVHEESAEQFKCPKCDKSFGRKDKLVRHNRSVHNLVNFNLSAVDTLKIDQDSYTCKVCSKSFSGFDARDMMIEHLAKRCKEDQMYHCESCEKSFSNVSNLNKHKRHSHLILAVDVLQCASCDFITKHNHSLLRHIRRKHSDKAAIEHSMGDEVSMEKFDQNSPVPNEKLVKGKLDCSMTLPVNQDMNPLKDTMTEEGGFELNVSDPVYVVHPMSGFDPVDNVQQAKPAGCLGLL